LNVCTAMCVIIGGRGRIRNTTYADCARSAQISELIRLIIYIFKTSSYVINTPMKTRLPAVLR
jgi:hypothetical protein